MTLGMCICWDCNVVRWEEHIGEIYGTSMEREVCKRVEAGNDRSGQISRNFPMHWSVESLIW